MYVDVVCIYFAPSLVPADLDIYFHSNYYPSRFCLVSFPVFVPPLFQDTVN